MSIDVRIGENHYRVHAWIYLCNEIRRRYRIVRRFLIEYLGAELSKTISFSTENLVSIFENYCQIYSKNDKPQFFYFW